MTLAKTEASGGPGLLPEVMAFSSSLSLDKQLLREDLVGASAVEVGVPGIVDEVGVVGHGAEAAGLPLLATPVVDQLVARDTDEPRRRELRHLPVPHRGDRGDERLRGQVLGDGGAPAAGEQVSEHLGEGVVVEREQDGALVRYRDPVVVCPHGSPSSQIPQLRHPRPGNIGGA